MVEHRLKMVLVLLAIVWSASYVVTSEVVIENQVGGRICKRINIKSPHDFEQLRGCSVVEGSLQINIMTLHTHWLGNLSLPEFPELREITGFFMVFYTTEIITLKKMFPNLAVIRGQELVEDFALVVFKMPHMQEIGLPSLTDILRGAIWIVANENLCYVDTIDWGRIAKNESNRDGIFKNKQQCPNTCSQCPISATVGEQRNLCWSKEHCQVISCPGCGGGPCYTDSNGFKKCCNSECLGGCFGPSPSQCHVCKRVVVNRPEPFCSDRCPSGFYEYLQRRCVTAAECLNITANVAISSSPSVAPKTIDDSSVNGKWLNSLEDGRPMCVLECPKGTELAPNKTACIPCGGNCQKNCPGRTVDSIETAREFNGCTRIQGALRIHIRKTSSSSVNIIKELKENLDRIEVIDDYLAVTYTFSIYSLDFLSNLKVIKGMELEDKKYALIVKSNDNLMELWNSSSTPNKTIKISNPEARVLFHYNPKLCHQKIMEFVNQAGIKKPDRDDNTEISTITNGDKAPCNTQKLRVEIVKKTNSTIQLRCENFRRNLTLPSHLLNYEIHYKEAPEYPGRNESKLNDRDPCGDDGWNVQERAKLSDRTVEPEWEDETLITNLKPYTYYALYMKAIVIQDVHVLNENTGAESDILYFRTLSDIPERPGMFRLAATSHDKITLTWKSPSIVNGKLAKYQIWMKMVPENQEQQDERDYCRDRRAPLVSSNAKVMESFIATTFAPILPESPSKDCCSCKAKSTQEQMTQNVYAESTMLDTIMGYHVFSMNFVSEDPNSNAIRPRNNRRKRAISSETDMKSTSDETIPLEHLFPANGDTLNETGRNLPSVIPVADESFILVGEVIHNSSVNKYSFVVENLTHYTTYKFGVEACRAQDAEILLFENDTRLCSERNEDWAQTAFDPTADEIDSTTITLNVTSKGLNIRWSDPPHPNGVIMGYNILLQKVGTNKEEVRDRACITHRDFIAKGKNYTYGEKLSPGNYSLTIQVASLARDSNFSAAQYFYIEDTDETSPGFLALLIVLPLLLIIGIASCFAYYLLKNHYIIPGPRIISANPEYMPNVDIAEQWEVPRDNVKLIKELGKGAFGVVYLGKLLDFVKNCPEVPCAVKSYCDETPSEDRARFLTEAALMTKLECHHLVKLLGIVSKTQPIYVVMELMENGDLKQYLRQRRPDSENTCNNPPPTLKQILRMASEVADGMMYIHSRRLVHRDLACRNLLVTKDLTVKVGDFGMTKEISDYYRKQTRGFLPVRWMAPESLRDGVFTSPSDIWSFGVVLWEMATLAALPYLGLGNSQVIDFVLSGRVMDMPERCPQILYDMMTMCWQYDYRQRPTFNILLDRLVSYLEPSFAQVSFYHSPEGIDYRAQASLRSVEEEPVTIRTPLMATFDICDDDDLEYDSDDDLQGLNHHIIDDLNVNDGPSCRLLNATPVKTLIQPSSSPLNKSSFENGVPLTPLSISGNNNSSYLKVGNTEAPYQPSSLFSNPPLHKDYINQISTPAPTPLPIAATATSATNFTPYTETVFVAPVSNNLPPPSNFSIPLTPVKSDVISNSKSGQDKSPSNKGLVTYSTVTPVNQQGQITPKFNIDLDTNDSSKARIVNCDEQKCGNGTKKGGNGYILPLSESQRNKTTQF